MCLFCSSYLPIDHMCKGAHHWREMRDLIFSSKSSFKHYCKSLYTLVHMEQSSDIFFVNGISFWTFFKDRQSSSSLTSDGNSVILFYKPA